MGPTILEQLRVQTRPAHRALETQPLLKRLLSRQLSEADYCQLLLAFLAFYQALERVLIPATEVLLSRYPDRHYRYLPRTPFLVADCEAMGLDSTDLVHRPVELSLNDHGTNVLGALYVIEGSTQGGRVIARHLDDTLGVTERSGASFFNIHQHDSSWTGFRRWLSTNWAYNHQEDNKRIIEGADMTFSALHTHLDHWQSLSHDQ